MSRKSLREPLDSYNHKKIRRKIIILRKISHLTQRGLALKLSINQSYVSKVESGLRRLDILEFQTYLNKLDYSVEQFLLEIDEA